MQTTTTVRIPEDKRDMLKIIASIEKKDMKEILSELIDEHIERHTETLELLSNPSWARLIRQGRAEVKNNVKGKSLDELEG